MTGKGQCCNFFFFFSTENFVFTKLSSTFNVFKQVHFNVSSRISRFSIKMASVNCFCDLRDTEYLREDAQIVKD